MNAENEFPDAAGYPDGAGTLSEGLEDTLSSLPFTLVDDLQGAISAIAGDEELASIKYSKTEHHITVLSTFVWPDYRGQNVATELIRRALEKWRDENYTLTVVCPAVRRFIDRHPQFVALEQG
jgi:predicted GNAT family acetyltransferase